jgi:hypothetical protein
MTQLLPDLAKLVDVRAETLQVDATQLTPPAAYGRAPAWSWDADSPGYVYYGAANQLYLTQDQQTLLTWVEKAIRTPRGRYPVYGDDLAAGLGSAGVTEAQLNAEDDLRRCLTLHPLIADVRDVSFSQVFGPDTLVIFMTVVDATGGTLNLQVTT